MVDSEAEDYPPANLVNNQNEINIINDIEQEYPIIRCENCHEILLMTLALDKNEIILECEKEKKIEKISLKLFFENINKYKNSNCCNLCNEKNLSQKYYLCKTCSNLIICQNCFEKHNKDDEVEKLNKIDSLCKKHFNQIESFCDVCKEHKCFYCIPEHDEKHKNKEYLIRDKLFRKNRLDNFIKNLINISEVQKKIEKIINEVIDDLQKKIKSLIDLKNKFSETLNMKVKFSNLVYQNYLKKFKDTDLNFFLIKNLENEIDFGLKDLKIEKEKNLEERIGQIVTYLNSNIYNHFNNKLEDNSYEEKNNFINNKMVKAEDINYNIEREIQYDSLIDVIDFNDNLYAIYNQSSISFISKGNKNNTIKFKIIEEDLQRIKSCQKNENDKIMVLTDENLIFIQILEDSDYIILNKKPISIGIFEYNSLLDILYSNSYKIYLLSFPNYNKAKMILSNYNYNIIKFQFIKNNLFFIFGYKNLSSYLIENNNAKLLNETNQINIDNKNCIIIDLNKLNYAVNNKDKIYILNKNDLNLQKTININIDSLKYKPDNNSDNYYYSSYYNSNDQNYYFTTLFKISEHIITVFIFGTKKNIVNYRNYELSMSGIKWELKKEVNFINKSLNSLKSFNNQILLLGSYTSELIDINALWLYCIMCLLF